MSPVIYDFLSELRIGDFFRPAALGRQRMFVSPDAFELSS